MSMMKSRLSALSPLILWLLMVIIMIAISSTALQPAAAQDDVITTIISGQPDSRVAPRHPLTPIPEFGPLPIYPYPAYGVGIPGTVVDVNVEIPYLVHPEPFGLDILLVGPQGQAALVMSDACYNNIQQSDFTILTLDDEAEDFLPNTTGRQCRTGSYTPTNWNSGSGVSPDDFPAPAPQGVTNSALSVFDGTDANGQWSMYVVDNRPGTGGFFHDFRVIITTTVSTYVAIYLSPTPSPTASNTLNVTATFTATATNTPTATSTSTRTNTATNTPSATATLTNTATNTVTDTATNTQTNTPSATATSTNTSTNTATSTGTVTNTLTSTATNTATATNSPTNTATSTATNTQNGSVCIIVSRTSFSVTEGGISVLYNVRLSQAPSASEQVTITPTGFDGSQISFSPVNRKLDSTNWNTGRNFTVTAVDNGIPEASPLFTTIQHIATSTLGGSPFNNAPGCQNIAVSVFDNDSGATATSTATASATNTTIFTSTFTATATSTSTATNTTVVTVTFTSTATATSITPTVTASATSVTAACIVVSNLVINVTEGSGGITYNVRLNQLPSAGEQVTIVPVGFDGTQITITPAERKLDSTNWNTGRSFTLTAVNDTLDEPSPMTMMLSHTSTSTLGGSPYNGATSCTHSTVNVYDND